MKIETLNLEEEKLSCDEAVAKALNEINTLALDPTVRVLKIIHGYGSTGEGGAIKKDLYSLLYTMLKYKRIENFCHNERFTTQNELYSRYTKLYPELILDKDLQNQNPGITLVFLN